MVNKFAKKTVLLALAAGLSLGASLAQAQERVYVIDQRDTVVKSGTGLCWRDGYWTPAAAAADKLGCECDPDIVPKSSCGAAPVVPVVKPVTPIAKPVTPAIVAEKVQVAADALFDFGKATLRPEGKAKLDEIAAKAQAIKLEVILAVGHTDRLGSDAANQKLSEKRAAAVKEYLVSKKIDANRVYTEGKGEKQPVTGDKCKGDKATKALVDCLQPDRRVAIELIGTK